MTHREKMQLANVRIKHLELLNKALDKGIAVSFWPRIEPAKFVGMADVDGEQMAVYTGVIL